MKRVMVMANKSLLVDEIASILSQEIRLDVVRMSHREFSTRTNHILR